MVADYVLRPDSKHGLDALAEELLRYRMISYEELAGKGKEQKRLRNGSLPRIAEYAAQDADITFRVYRPVE